MNLSEKLMVALIAGGISLVASLVGVVVSLRQVKVSERKIKEEIQHKYLHKLYDKRIELYPEAFKISSKIKKKKKPDGINPPQEIKMILSDLDFWAEGEAGLFLSPKTIRAYWDLRDALSKNPGGGENYQEQQINNIWQARVNFRSALRRDIGVMHYADTQKIS